MRRLLLAIFLVGCVPPQPTKPPAIEVVVIQLPIHKTKGEMVEVIEVGEPEEVPHTWMTGEEVKRAKHERLIKEHPECDVAEGDPLSECLWE